MTDRPPSVASHGLLEALHQRTDPLHRSIDIVDPEEEKQTSSR